MSRLSKIGIIQNAPLTADLSNNLRQIVQGYRECLDHGAQLVIAASDALCGHELQALAYRRSFLHQTRMALKALSAELGSVPLILGAYTFLFDDEQYESNASPKVLHEFDMICNDEAEREKAIPTVVPYLLEHDTVTELIEGEVTDIHGTQVYIDCDDMEILPEYHPLHLIVRLPDKPWYAGGEGDDARTRCWEARHCGVPVIQVKSVGTADGKLFDGGSALYGSNGQVVERLPFFEPGNRVLDLKKRSRASNDEEVNNILRRALVRGIYDTVRNNGYSGVSICMDQKNAPLLVALSILALGADNVWGVTFEGNCALAETMGISCRQINIAPVSAEAAACMAGTDSRELQSRLAAAMQVTLSEQRGFMQLTALSRNEIMTGNFTLYGESCGYLAPLANLYEEEVCLLCKQLRKEFPCLASIPEYPENPELNFIIRDLADKNLPSSALLEGLGSSDYKENDVRLVQRKIIASALKRSQFPMTLHIEPDEEQNSYPISHRLND